MYRERVTITVRGSLLRQLDAFIDGKDVRNRSHAVEKLLIEKFGDTLIRQAVLLGGGKGVDIGGGKISSPLLVSVHEKLVVERHIEQLKQAGVEEVYLAVGNFGDDVRAAVGDGSKYDIKVIYFERDRGTASVLRQAKSLLKETFLFLNGHILFKSADLEDMIVFHKNQRSLCTMALSPVAHPEAMGQALLRGTHIVQFAEKPETTLSHLANAGIYVVEPELCERVTPETLSLEREVFAELAQESNMSGYVLDIPWRRITEYENK